MLDVNEAELVKRAKTREPDVAAGSEAVCELYDRYHTLIFRYLWSRLPDRQTAEDLTGEVFTRMVAGLPKYSISEAPFRAWLFRIARNLLIDHYRKEGNKREIALEQIAYMHDSAADPADKVEDNLFIERVHQGMMELQPIEQEVIILRFLVGLSLQEVASILQKTVGAIKIAQHRGLRELRVILKGETNEV